MYVENSFMRAPALNTLNEMIETELPLTPIQQEIIFHRSKGTEPQTICFGLDLPNHAFFSFDLIQHTWQAVASHNPVLRTQLEITDTFTFPIKGKQQILKRISLLRFSQPSVSRSSEGHEAAQLVINTEDHQTSASIHIHRALVDTASLTLIRKDFELFHMGLAFNRHSKLEKFVMRMCSKDQEKAKLFWNANLRGLASLPIHCFPPETCGPKDHVTSGLGPIDRIRASATSLRMPIQTIFYAAWSSTLAWHTEAGNNEVYFTVIGRDRSIPRNLSVVGPADQMYPLKVVLPPNTLIRQWIGDIDHADEEASSHAFIGYKSILAESQISSRQTLVIIRSADEKSLENVSGMLTNTRKSRTACFLSFVKLRTLTCA